MNKIRIFTTGGTIDKVYFDAKSSYEVGESSISTLLFQLNVNFDYAVTSLLQKDSLEMDDADRELILNSVKSAKEKLIIITHGTDTMVDTAKMLSQVKNKTIVLTGALQPALFKGSDAMFNIGCAVAAVQTLPTGVYITMNGQVFKHDNVIKDVANNQFIPLKK